MTITDLIYIAILISDLAFAISIVFFERKNPADVWAWLLVLFFLPVLGFILYVFLGQNYRKKKMFQLKQDDDIAFRNIVELQKSELKGSAVPAMEHLSAAFRRMVLMLIEDNSAIFTANNEIKVYADGREKFADLIAAIKGARDHIHLEYDLWRNDGLSAEIQAALTERARAGVEVKLLCDGFGCAPLPRHFFDELKNAGGQVAFFFPSLLRFLNLRSNFRNHRKIAVIDGKIGFVGGFNIGDEYPRKGQEMGILARCRCANCRIGGFVVPAPVLLRLELCGKGATPRGAAPRLRAPVFSRYHFILRSGRADSLRRARHVLEPDKRGIPEDDQLCHRDGLSSDALLHS